MFLSSFSVSCQCLPLILIAVPVPGKELQGHSSQKLLPPLLLLLLLLNVVAAVSGDSPVPVSGFLGEQVVLPCTYKGNVPVSLLRVIWKTLGTKTLYEFRDGDDDLSKQDSQFENRTNLFKDQLEQGNWSVLLSDLRETDQGEYLCLIYKRTVVQHFLEQRDCVYLSVRVHSTQEPNEILETDYGPGLSTGARVGLGIGIAAVFVVPGIVGYIVLKRQRRNCVRSQHSSDRNEASNGVPLREVVCSGEARSLVPTAPEHQDGAAGEQNLLGNGAAQH
ncbi:sodium channel subunit beta-4-like isoform X1 [Hemiscyllium ocellatum]|uniref:sodium channel subunit beta-4-like isoform X1 n=1 Tax=Hemiscyllium ocellatum TaxID=170820 RepID=UPI0029673D9D|nr:sodium channel subunit beta-4-like isoform X1 [Hemiscyllium ocellatum]